MFALCRLFGKDRATSNDRSTRDTILLRTLEPCRPYITLAVYSLRGSFVRAWVAAELKQEVITDKRRRVSILRTCCAASSPFQQASTLDAEAPQRSQERGQQSSSQGNPTKVVKCEELSGDADRHFKLQNCGVSRYG